MKSSFVLVTLALLAGSGVAARQVRQAPLNLPAVPQPTFRASVDLVHLDVSVLDRNRRPVRGLVPADFTLLEDGTPQRISVFQAVDIPDAAPPATAWLRDVAPDVRSNAGLQDRRLFLLLLDDATLQSDLRAVRNMKDVARRVVERLGPSDLAAVVFTRDNRNSQDYTADRARLLGAIDKVTIGSRDMTSPLFADMGVDSLDDRYYVFSANVLENAVKVLGTMPDRRKVIVYVGQGLPVDVEQAGSGAPGLEDRPKDSAAGSGLAGRLRNQLEETFRRAARANVNVYTMDVCGLRAQSPVRLPGTPSGPTATCEPGLEVDYLQRIAANTGARAVLNTNDFGPGVQAMFAENASYYLLGYQPQRSPDGKLRRLEVRVNRPGVQVRTRNGYEAARPRDVAQRKAALATSPLGVALSGLLPQSDLPLEMAAVPFALPGKREAAVAMVVGIKQPIRAGSSRTTDRVDLIVSAFNVDGKAFGTTRMNANVTIRAGASGLAEYEVLSRIDLEPGRYQLRVAAHVGSLSTSGSLYYDIDVPDFRSRAVSLSPLMLVAAPALPVAPRDAFKGISAVVPTTRRVFAAGDRVSAVIRTYQGATRGLTAVPLQVHLVNDKGITVMNSRQDLGVQQFTSGRFADVAIDVPVSRLPAGEYLLTVEAGTGPSLLRRRVRFSVLSPPA